MDMKYRINKQHILCIYDLRNIEASHCTFVKTTHTDITKINDSNTLVDDWLIFVRVDPLGAKTKSPLVHEGF